MNALRRVLLAAAALPLPLLLQPARAAEEPVVHVYNWADYIGETTLADEIEDHLTWDEAIVARLTAT